MNPRLPLLALSLLVPLGCRRAPSDPPAGAGNAPPAPTVVDAAKPAAIDADARADNDRAVALMGQYAYDEACDILARVVAAQPQWLDARFNLALATLNRQRDGDEAAAIALLEAILADAPDRMDARYMLALLQFRGGESEAATTNLERVAEADPDDPYVSYFLGQCLEPADGDRALTLYARALAADPYLRSAYYRAASVLRRLGKASEADAMLATFMRLDGNPRARTVEFIYTKMGRKGMAIASAAPSGAWAPCPDGALFGPADPIAPSAPWADGPAIAATVGDLEGDGDLDVVLPGALRGDEAVNAVLLGGETGLVLVPDHPLAAVRGLRAVLMGDLDDDGRTDLYLCRDGANLYWRARDDGGWDDVTAEAGVGGDDLDTVDGALVDLDHDGDLDVWCANADGPDELFANLRNGAFKALAAEAGLGGGAEPSTRVVVADFDRSRDLDVLVLRAQPPHDLHLNDRLWSWRAADARFAAILGAPMDAAIAIDVDADGRDELVSARRGEGVTLWDDEQGAWAPVRRWVVRGAADRMGVLDVDGDARLDLVLPTAEGWAVLAFDRDASSSIDAVDRAWSPILVEPARGPAIVGAERSAAMWPAGPGRCAFTAVRFTGRDDPGQSMRSNASGIGVRAVARLDGLWSAAAAIRSSGQPGQGLQPWSLGLAGRPNVEFLAIEWTDGILQSELHQRPNGLDDRVNAFDAGAITTVPEVQREVSSCPVIFAHDGDGWRFVSDILGVGGIGYLLEPGAYGEPRPRERFLLPAGVLAERDGACRIMLAEPMEEVCYLDGASMLAIDLPPGWTAVVDERMAVAGAPPTGDVLFSRRFASPVRATDQDGVDVAAEVMEADGRPVPLPARDRRFIGRLAEDALLELEFDAPLDGVDGRPVLVADGWVEYPYSQTMFAAWQAGAAFRAPTLEARDGDGAWHAVAEEFGYPAGMPRTMALPLPALPEGCTAIRLRTNQVVHWDRVRIAWSEPLAAAVVHELAPTGATLSTIGYPRRLHGPHGRPDFDFDRRTPTWDVRSPVGRYTREGDVLGLIGPIDGACAIFGPGEAVECVFGVPEAPPPGWTRTWVLDATGWCKDMDRYTLGGESVEPVPGDRRTAEAARLHADLNIRTRP